MSTCPHCGREVAADAPLAVCPECLLKAGLASRDATMTDAAGAGSPDAQAFTAPAPAVLQPSFPQLEITELIGQGGMGAVYKARQPGLDRWVALKVLPPAKGADAAFFERFTREARALARLSHPGIVAVHDFGQAGGFIYFVMEYLDGVNLRHLLRSGRVSPREAMAIVPQICEALQYAHDHGIVHRDIKPENILVDKQGRVKIADFGLAKLMEAPASGDRLTQAQEAMGTPQYMAPEQIEHPLEVDHRADIYSLGVVFYEMLTGELPLGRFPPPSQKVRIDVRLDEVVLRSLEKAPERRYQHASEVKTQVETIVARSAPPPAPEQRLSGLALAGAITGLAALMLLSLSYLTPLGGLPKLLLLVTALPASTLLGVLAVSEIRRSSGRVWGLGLAVFDALLFPLLLLDMLIVWLVFESIRFGTAWILARPASLSEPDLAIVAVAALPAIVLADILLARWVWRMANRPPQGAETQNPEVERRFTRVQRAWALALLAVVPISLLLALAHIRIRHVRLEALHTLARAASIEQAQKSLSEANESRYAKAADRTTPPERYTQDQTLRLDRDGTARFVTVITQRNSSASPLDAHRFVNSDFVDVKRVTDWQGREIPFAVRRQGELFRYSAPLSEPVQPGEWFSVTIEGFMKGLVKPADEPGVFAYRMRHWPAVDEGMRRIERHLLPEGATLIYKEPPELREGVRDGRIELSIDRVIPPGDSLEVVYRYRLETVGVKE